jgi:hypothetical protein
MNETLLFTANFIRPESHYWLVRQLESSYGWAIVLGGFIIFIIIIAIPWRLTSRKEVVEHSNHDTEHDKSNHRR